MGNRCPSRLVVPNWAGPRLDSEISLFARSLYSLPSGAWEVLLCFADVSHAMLLRTMSKTIADRIQRHGISVKVGAVAPFLGETCTSRCLELFSDLFPRLQCLSASVFTLSGCNAELLQELSRMFEAALAPMSDMFEALRHHPSDDGDGIGLVMPQLIKLRNLHTLDLKVSACDPVALMKVSLLRGFRSLSLNGPMTDQVLQAIGQKCPLLEELSLYAKEHAGDEGLVAIAKGCRSLRKATLQNLGSSDHAIASVVSGCSRGYLASVDVGSQTLDVLAANVRLLDLTFVECADPPGDSLSQMVRSSRNLQNLTMSDCGTYLWLDNPSHSIRHLTLEGQRFLHYQFKELANWSQLERIYFMYWTLDDWTGHMLNSLIKASPFLRHLREVHWAAQLPEDKKSELATGLAPCLLFVDAELVLSTSGVASPRATAPGTQIGEVAAVDMKGYSVEVSDSMAEFLDDRTSAVICPQYIGADGEEPPADVTPEDASYTSGQLWASGVEQLIRVSSPSSSSHDQSPGSRLVLLTFGRFPKEMQDTLLQTQIATSLLGEGCNVQPCWAKGGLVLASGVNEDAVAEARDTWHVAVREVDELQIYEALKNLPYNKRPRMKPGGRFPIPEDCILFADISAASSGEFTLDGATNTSGDITSSIEYPEILIKRTFLHIPPLPMARVSPRTSKTA